MKGLKVGWGWLVREALAGRTERDMGLEVKRKPEDTGMEWARKPRKILAGGKAGTWRQRTGAAKAGFVLQPPSGSHGQDTLLQ